MQQVFHILKKDIRHLRWEIALVFLVAALYALAFSMRVSAAGLVLYLLPLTGGLIIGRAIHAEPLPGDRQFWITRPYRRGSLLVAKLLFVLLFVNLPLLVADLAIAIAYGFSIPDVIPALLWRQVLATGAFVLPVAAVATVTESLVEMLLILVAVVAITIGTTFFHSIQPDWSWAPLVWIETLSSIAVLTAVSALCIGWQYARRRTVINRTAIAGAWVVAAFVCPMIPWSAVYRVQSVFSRSDVDPSAVQVAFNRSRPWLSAVAPDKGGQVHFEFPAVVSGIPARLTPVFDGVTLEIEAPGGRVWQSGKSDTTKVSTQGTVTSIETSLPRDFYDQVKQRPVKIRGSLYVTLVGDQQEAEVPIGGQPARVPGGGVCTANQRAAGGIAYNLECYFAFRQPPGWLSAGFIQQESVMQWPPNYSPFPAEAELNPMWMARAFSLREPGREQELRAVRVVLTRPVAHVRRDFEFDGITIPKLSSTGNVKVPIPPQHRP